MPSTYYTLLWVVPTPGAKNVPALEQLDNELGLMYARVMVGTSLERKAIGQTAIRLFEAADEPVVLQRLQELHYIVVDRETRLSVD